MPLCQKHFRYELSRLNHSLGPPPTPPPWGSCAVKEATNRGLATPIATTASSNEKSIWAPSWTSPCNWAKARPIFRSNVCKTWSHRRQSTPEITSPMWRETGGTGSSAIVHQMAPTNIGTSQPPSGRTFNNGDSGPLAAKLVISSNTRTPQPIRKSQPTFRDCHFHIHTTPPITTCRDAEWCEALTHKLTADFQAVGRIYQSHSGIKWWNTTRLFHLLSS